MFVYVALDGFVLIVLVSLLTFVVRCSLVRFIVLAVLVCLS